MATLLPQTDKEMLKWLKENFKDIPSEQKYFLLGFAQGGVIKTQNGSRKDSE